MSDDLRATLQQALGSAYRIERELTDAGMSRVFVATEERLNRSVVIKVLSPERSGEIDAERFEREIRLAAGLQDPSIVPVLTAGDAGGIPYYTMPFVEGESLRVRMARGAVPFDEAIAILRDVASALEVAHAHGVVHRDIKPDNVLLSGRRAVVTDFGIARALSVATERYQTLTSAGTSLGTPAYMSPEQATGEEAGTPADIYSWGVLAYELLAGKHPFADRKSATQLMAAHVTEQPPPLRNVDPSVAAVVMSALEKDPARRPRPADLLAHLKAQTTPAAGRLRPRGPIATALVAVVAALVAMFAMRRDPPARQNVIAIFPFRVSAAEPSLTYLREGMLDLLAAKLMGDPGPRAVEPRTLLAAMRESDAAGDAVSDEELRRIATSLGASRILLGSVVGTASRLTLSASVSAPDGSAEESLASVEGPADSLSVLVDRLAAQVLAIGAGRTERQAASESRVALPALRAYLEGRAAYRRGRFAQARAAFERALEVDSTFGRAAIELAQAGQWMENMSAVDRGIRLGWEQRSSLTKRDRILLEVITASTQASGQHMPGRGGEAQLLVLAESLTVVAPDDPDAWYWLADHMLHFGATLGTTDYLSRAQAGFDRVVSLDSTFSPALQHLVDVAVIQGDTARARYVALRALALDSLADNADYVRWRLARATGDSQAIVAIRARMPAMTFENLRRIAGYAVADGIASEDAYAAARAMKTRASGQDARFFAAATEGILMLNSGRPDAAAPVLASLSPLARLSGVLDEALFWGGDSARAASRLQDMLRVNRTMIDTSFVTAWTIAAWYYALGDLAQGDAWRARTMALAPAMQRAGVIGLGGEPLAPALLDAWHAVVHRRPDARARLERAEVARRASPPEPGISESALILARLWEELGEPRRALQLLEAMPYHHVAYMHLYLSTHRREAGRLAAQLGERELAIRNYRQYLEYRRKPEPALREEAAFVRRELDRLLSADREKRP